MATSTSAPAPLTGRVLGDFTVREKIGEGGYGAVYRAEQRGLGREAVVKVLHERHGASARVVQRFLREAQLASRLDHPYAAHLYAFGAEPDGLLWIAMERVRGTPLAEVLAAQPGARLALTRWVPLCERLCEVVHTAHEQGIVHRDLKPDNVMVIARAGRLLPKLLDLGVAKRVAEVDDGAAVGDGAAAAAPAVDGAALALTQRGARVGSPHYMAPEQWDGGDVDARADVYALGVITYEALAGVVPFRGRTLAELARGHAREAPPPLPDDVPAAVGDVVRRALAKRPADRFATALELAAALRLAAGMSLGADAVPRLDDELRAEAAWLPQPLAESIAALEAARNPHQARDAVWRLVDVAARWLGVIALAARSRVGARGGDAPAAVALLRELARRELAADEWLELARHLARPFDGAIDAHPVPELCELALAEPPFAPFAPLLALRARDGATTSEQTLGDWLGAALPLLGALVRALGFTSAYQIVVRRGADAEVWMGARRGARPLIGAAPELPEGEPALADLDGRPVLALAPLCAVAPPAPGAPPELFVFAGAGRGRGRGARLTAEPHGFERHDDAVWTWFRAHILGVDGAAPAEAEAAPYRGLAPFTVADAARFVGRERQVEAVVNQLLVAPLVAVVGPSGAGKSSFVMAGVIAQLPAGWRAVVLRPGAAPEAAWARALADAGPAAPGETLVVVVDQLEELFTLGADAAARERFAALIAAAAGGIDARDPGALGGGARRVIVTLRDDFLVRAGELVALRERLAQGLVLLATPSPDDLTRIVVEPARRAGYDFDDGELPARMVREVAGRPGALALLSFTAAQLWELRDRHFKRLTRAAYDAVGGVGGALAAHADATVAACAVDEQRLVREAFRHLVTAEGTRAVIGRRELEATLGGGAAAAAVIERLVAARLVVALEDDTGDDRVELVHEALVAAWPRLAEWRRADADGARLRDQLRAAARQWDERGRPRGLLWRDDALDEYRRWRVRWPGALPAIDAAFAAASLADAARGRRWRRGLAGGAAAVLIAATTALAILYSASSRNARTARARLIASYVEQGRRLLLDGDYLRALPYLAAAYEGGERSPALRFLLHRALALADAPTAIGPRPMARAALRADGSLITIDEGGEVAVWDPDARRVRARLPAPPGAGAAPTALSPDGARAAVIAGSDVVVWDGARTVTLPVAGATAVVFDGAGARIAVAGGGALTTWTSDGAPIWRVTAPDDITQLQWIGDAVIEGRGERDAVLVRAVAPAVVLAPATRLAGGAAGRFALVEEDGVQVRAASGALLVRLAAPGAAHAALTHDGARVAVVGSDGVIELFDVASGRALASLSGHRGAARIAFTPDDAKLVSVGEDHTVRVWDLTSRAELVRLLGTGSSTELFAIDPAGRHVVVAGPGGARVLPLVDPGATLTVDAGEPVSAATFIGDGSSFFAGVDSGGYRWDARTGAVLARVAVGVYDGAHASPDGARAVFPLFRSTDAEVRALATGAVIARLHGRAAIYWAVFDHAGDRILTCGDGGTADVWDAGGAHLTSLVGHHGTILGAAWSPDDRRIVTAGYDDLTVRLWDAATGRELARASVDGGVYTAAFDDAGARVVTAGEDRLVRVFDATTAAPLRAYEAETSLRAAAIDPRGRIVAASQRDGSVLVWDAASGQPLDRLRHGGLVSGLDVAADDRRLLTSSVDHRAVVWDIGDDVPAPDVVARRVACAVPYRLDGTTLVVAVPRCDTPP